jgi:hypothetical protein
LKILFSARSVAHLSYYDEVIIELTKRKHNVHIVFDANWSISSPKENLVRLLENKRVTYSWARQREGRYKNQITFIRELANYSWYCWRVDQSQYYKDRWLGYFRSRERKFLSKKYIQNLLSYEVIYNTLRRVVKFIPADRKIKEDVSIINPDLVIVSPGNMRFDTEIEYAIAANRIGIPTFIITLSWDNLTTKGLFHCDFNKIFVWNETHKNELLKLHKVPNEKICIAGSLFFQKWKSKKFNTGGIDPNLVDSTSEYVLYFGSSSNIARDEAWVVVAIAKLINDVNREYKKNFKLMVRPHPANHNVYKSIESDNIFIYPKNGSLPESLEAQEKMYQSIKNSLFTIGLNTSAFIDSIVIEKPTAVFVTEKYAQTQMESTHLSKLSKYNVLYQCESLDEVKLLILNCINGLDQKQQLRNSFVKSFVFPNDLTPSESICNVLESVNEQH